MERALDFTMCLEIVVELLCCFNGLVKENLCQTIDLERLLVVFSPG